MFFMRSDGRRSPIRKAECEIVTHFMPRLIATYASGRSSA
jgi:hypothetical protein